jgi:hypothetical protein
MLVKNMRVLVMFFVFEIFQQEIRALQSHFKFLPGASLNMPVKTTVLGSDILCAWLCIQAKPECIFAGYSREKGICELYATKFVVFSDVNNMFKLYSSGKMFISFYKFKKKTCQIFVYCFGNVLCKICFICINYF